jgi:hypothetical protein
MEVAARLQAGFFEDRHEALARRAGYVVDSSTISWPA